MNYNEEEITVKIKKCLTMVGNLHPNLYEKMLNDLYNYEEKTNVIKLKHLVTELLKIPAQGRHTINYWLSRGWSESESYYKAKEEAKTRKPKFSPFSKEFWMEKVNPITGENYTQDEAEFHRNTLRPIKKEYWMTRGYSESESIHLSNKVKNDNNSKGSIKRSQQSAEFKKSTNKVCVEYWLLQGYTEEEAKQFASERYNIFTLEKCVKRYGEKEGYKVWKERQDKWQNTLKNKSEKEILNINARKKSILMKDTIEETIEYYKKIRNMILVSSIEELKILIENDLIENPYKKYWLPEKYLHYIPKIQLEILSIGKEEFLNHIEHFFTNEIFILKTGKGQSYNKWTKFGLLRSSYEIYFYENFIKKFPNVPIKIDKKYPNSLMRYDFFINDEIFIEISPKYGEDKKYTLKIDKKKDLFNCIILKTTSDIDIFIENYKSL